MDFALVGMSHSPLLDITTQSEELTADVRSALGAGRAAAADFDPDVVVLFVPDHYNGFFYRLMPAFCIGTAATAVGDYDSPSGDLDVPAELAARLAQHVLDSGVDVAISHRMEVDHATAQPLRELFGSLTGKPVVPIFINAAAEPVAPLHRARALGAAVGSFFAGRDERVLFVASGGLSHDPPVPSLRTAPPPLAERLLTGRPLTDEEQERKHAGAVAEGERLAAGTSERMPLSPDWDQHFLDLLEAGKLAELDSWTTAEIAEHGCGAQEVRTWAAAYSALATAGPYRTEYRYYRPIPQYIAGFAVTVVSTGSTTEQGG